MYVVLMLFMRARSISQKQLAEHLGITETTFSNKIHGKSEFTLKECEQIKAYLKYPESIESLFQKTNGA